MFPNPDQRTQIFLIIFLPIFTNYIIPLFKNIDVIFKLRIFSPTIDNLDGVQGLWEKIKQIVNQFLR